MKELSILENLIVFYWFLLDINAYGQFNYWVNSGVQIKYAFKKVYNKL